MPLRILRQSLGGWPPLGLGCPSSLRSGSLRAPRSALTSQMVCSGLGWERFRAMMGEVGPHCLDQKSAFLSYSPGELRSLMSLPLPRRGGPPQTRPSQYTSAGVRPSSDRCGRSSL